VNPLILVPLASFYYPLKVRMARRPFSVKLIS
jgi:hypothetical protein